MSQTLAAAAHCCETRQGDTTSGGRHDNLSSLHMTSLDQSYFFIHHINYMRYNNCFCPSDLEEDRRLLEVHRILREELPEDNYNILKVIVQLLTEVSVYCIVLHQLHCLSIFGGSSDGVVLGLWSKWSECDSRSCRYDFRDWLSPASKSRYGWNIANTTSILKTTNQPILIYAYYEQTLIMPTTIETSPFIIYSPATKLGGYGSVPVDFLRPNFRVAHTKHDIISILMNKYTYYRYVHH